MKSPRDTDIKTICAKNEDCKFLGMTFSTYRRITKDKEENTRKGPKNSPQRAKNQNQVPYLASAYDMSGPITAILLCYLICMSY